MLGLNANRVVDFDIEKICRVCLQTDTEVSPLFDERNAVKGVRLSDMITECTMYPVCRYDGFPDLICYDCMDRVRIAYAFKKQYERSHRKLISFLELQLVSLEEQGAENEKCTRTDNTSLYPCEKCDEKFTNYDRLREHKSVAHKGAANLCRLCSTTFTRIADLKNHIAACHPKSGHPGTEHSKGLDKNIDMVQEQDSDILPASNSVGSPEMECCKNEMKASEDIEIDSGLTLKPKLEVVCSDPAAGCFSGGFAEPNSFRRAKDESPLPTRIHPIGTHHEDVITVKEEPGEMPKDTTLKDANRVKEDNTEHGIKSSQMRVYKCSHCDKTFTRNNNIRRHILSHSQEKPFSCHICGQRFSRSENLKTHLTKHTGDRPYKYDSCDRSFRRSDHLNRYRKQNHKEAILNKSKKSHTNTTP